MTNKESDKKKQADFPLHNIMTNKESDKKKQADFPLHNIIQVSHIHYFYQFSKS